MGSTENFHREIVRRLQSGELRLGVDRSFASNSKSVAFSKFWTLVRVLRFGRRLGHRVAIGRSMVVVCRHPRCELSGWLRHGVHARRHQSAQTGDKRSLYVRCALGRGCAWSQVADRENLFVPHRGRLPRVRRAAFSAEQTVPPAGALSLREGEFS